MMGAPFNAGCCSSRKAMVMSKVIVGLSMSLDGFIADKHDDVSLVFAWMGRAMEQFHEIVGDALTENGAVIMGHRSFDQICGEQGWGLCS
jgi:hypothetical protein